MFTCLRIEWRPWFWRDPTPSQYFSASGLYGGGSGDSEYCELKRKWFGVAYLFPCRIVAWLGATVPKVSVLVSMFVLKDIFPVLLISEETVTCGHMCAHWEGTKDSDLYFILTQRIVQTGGARVGRVWLKPTVIWSLSRRVQSLPCTQSLLWNRCVNTFYYSIIKC